MPTLNLYLFPHLYLCNEILSRLSILALPVRVHSRVAVKGHSWARLWYFLRAIDQEGRGKLEDIPLEFLNFWMGTKTSTLYQQLREGKAARAFQKWRVRKGKLGVVLGGLYPVTCKLGYTRDEHPEDILNPKEAYVGKRTKGRKPGLLPWGTTVTIQLFQILSLEGLRAIATAATTQRLQQLARYAAWRNLPKAIRHPIHPDGKPRTKHLPQPTEFFEETNRPSHSFDKGGIQFVLQISDKWVSVSKGFVTYGTAQSSVAQERGYLSKTTVQRHLKAVGIESKQIIQVKAAYGKIRQALHWSSMSFAPEPDISLNYNVWTDSYRLTEPSGGHHGNLFTYPVNKERFFKHSDREYIYRTSLYRPCLHLCRMNACREDYKNWLVPPPYIRSKKGVLQNSASNGKFSSRAEFVVSVIHEDKVKDSRRATKSLKN